MGRQQAQLALSKVVNIIVVPKAWVEKLGRGCLHGGTELLDVFTGRGHGGRVTPINWGEDGGDYHLDQEDVKRCGRVATNAAFGCLADYSEITAGSASPHRPAVAHVAAYASLKVVK